MLKRCQSFGVFFVMVVLSLGLFSCGKVTQVTKTEKESKTFNLTYQIPITPTASIGVFQETHGKNVTIPFVTLDDREVFVRVTGIDDEGKIDELSWGRAVLSKGAPVSVSQSSSSSSDVEEPAAGPSGRPTRGQNAFGIPPSSTPTSTTTSSSESEEADPEQAAETETETETLKTVYKSVSYRKDGVRLTNSDYGWSLLKVDELGTKWSGTSHKLKLGYGAYMVMFYLDSQSYMVSVFSKEEISDKGSLNLGERTLYDTFLGILFYLDLRQSEGGLKNTASLPQLTELFSQVFFDELNYTLPRNSAKKFSVKTPVFYFEGEFEQQCIEILKLVKAKEYSEAEALLAKYLEDGFPEKAGAILEKQLQSYGQSESETETTEQE